MRNVDLALRITQKSGHCLPKVWLHSLGVAPDVGFFGNEGAHARLTFHPDPEFPKHDQGHAMLNGARQSVGSTQSHICGAGREFPWEGLLVAPPAIVPAWLLPARRPE